MQDIQRVISIESLHHVVGGDDYEGSPDGGTDTGTGTGGDVNYDASAGEPAQSFDASVEPPQAAEQPEALATPSATPEPSSANAVDPDTGIPLPDYNPLPPPELGPNDIIPPGPSAEERFRTQVDIAQNYRDLASPTELFQGGREDCFNVAAINALNASDPEAVSSLVGDTRNPNVMQVSTLNPDGNRVDNTYVNPWQLQPVGPARGMEPNYSATGEDLRGGGFSDDPYLQSLYNATTQRYHPSLGGGHPGYAMERLGASTETGSPDDIVRNYQQNGGGAVVWTPPGEAGAQPYNLQPWHAYQVSGVVRNEADGRDYAVLTNPHYPYADGSPRHPDPIPVDELPRYFSAGTIGRMR